MGHRRAPSLCASEMRYFPSRRGVLPLKNRHQSACLPRTPCKNYNPQFIQPLFGGCPSPTAQCEKTAEERFHTLARGWLAYPVTPIHSLLPPKSGCICHPSVCKSNDTHTNAITLRIIYPTVLRRLPPSEKTPSSTHCANYPFLISPTTTYLFFRQKH